MEVVDLLILSSTLCTDKYHMSFHQKETPHVAKTNLCHSEEIWLVSVNLTLNFIRVEIISAIN